MNIWDRQKLFISDDQQQKLNSSCVLVAGVGANGSVAAESLVRLGIGKIILADPDLVEANNLNRQNYVAKDIGKPKIEGLKKRLLSIQPDLVIEIFREGISFNNVEKLVEKSNVVVENCDDYAAKVLISRYQNRLEKPTVHSAGGAFRGAVTVFETGDTYETLFELPTQGIEDSALSQVDFISHRKTVIEKFGAKLFDNRIMKNLGSNQYAQWPTLMGACDVAAHIAALQVLWILTGQEEYIIRAPEVFVFDIRTLEFKTKNYSSKGNKSF